MPFDNTSSYRRGSRLAPDSIRYAYGNLESFDPYYGVNYPDIPVADLGNLEELEDVEEILPLVEHSVSTIRKDGKVPIMLGGEHSITYGAIRNFQDCSMVIIDAHSDFREQYMGSPYNHACVTRRSLDVLGPGRIFSVGTRSISREEYESERFSDVRFFTANEVRGRGIERIAGEISAVAGEKVYFSIDMDGIDPAYAPAVGTPEPYGITPLDVRYLINTLGKKIVGFDVLEFSPVYDNGNTSMLAAKLIQDFIGSRETEKKLV